jgi:hypothetical protein
VSGEGACLSVGVVGKGRGGVKGAARDVPAPARVRPPRVHARHVWGKGDAPWLRARDHAPVFLALSFHRVIRIGSLV